MDIGLFENHESVLKLMMMIVANILKMNALHTLVVELYALGIFYINKTLVKKGKDNVLLFKLSNGHLGTLILLQFLN